ncbi:MAG: hypothetical protein JWR17_4731 [Pseudomonas sp.]|nr:hypothetical protein [Pseudomonas sp.]
MVQECLADAESGQLLNIDNGNLLTFMLNNFTNSDIETSPAITGLKQFMSSDYLLAGLGYDLDDSAERLGDGLY